MKKARFFGLVAFLLVALMVVGCAPVAEPTEEVVVEEATEETVAEEPAEEAAVPAECAEANACAVFAPGDTVKIGFAGPTTGDYSAFGIDISQGGQIAVTDFGEFEGWQFELLVEDDQGSGEGGAAVANLYASNPQVVAVHGHTFSGAAAAAIPIYNAARIPMLSASATRADLVEGDQDVFNRIPFTDDLQGAAAAAFMKDSLGLTTIAVMHDGDAYGKGLAETVAATFEEMGGTVVSIQAITPGETDYSAALAAIAAFAPEAIYFGGYYAEAAVIATQMAVAGMPDAALVTDDGTFGATFVELAGADAEGAYAAASRPAESEPVLAFDAAYMAAYGIEPFTLSTFTYNGYDVAAMLIQAVKDVAIVGGDGNLYVPREALIAHMRDGFSFEGLSGTLQCSEIGECNKSGPTFFVVTDGVWVPVAG